MARGRSTQAAQGSVHRLIAAERAWQESLDAARAAAEASVAAAAADARRREADAEADLDASAAARQRALAADGARAAAAAGAVLARMAARFTGVTDAFVDALADEILDGAPWFAPEAPEVSEVSEVSGPPEARA